MTDELDLSVTRRTRCAFRLVVSSGDQLAIAIDRAGDEVDVLNHGTLMFEFPERVDRQAARQLVDLMNALIAQAAWTAEILVTNPSETIQ